MYFRELRISCWPSECTSFNGDWDDAVSFDRSDQHVSRGSLGMGQLSVVLRRKGGTRVERFWRQAGRVTSRDPRRSHSLRAPAAADLTRPLPSGTVYSGTNRARCSIEVGVSPDAGLAAGRARPCSKLGS